jgi:hypothetical protein
VWAAGSPEEHVLPRSGSSGANVPEGMGAPWEQVFLRNGSSFSSRAIGVCVTCLGIARDMSQTPPRRRRWRRNRSPAMGPRTVRGVIECIHPKFVYIQYPSISRFGDSYFKVNDPEEVGELCKGALVEFAYHWDERSPIRQSFV